ncbi:MAG: hypothetical protein COB33_008410 [Thiotrichaceae bacterium]|nr:hypothetical protein [Thiotrichaceae bacterium]PCI14729.1 MAG: hypothetical protein COB71_01265 [Thiotrichales bacterium]
MRYITLNRRQNGAVLIVSLMLLAIMSLIGVTAMRTTIMQEKMSGNSRDLMLAFQAAEAGIKDAEGYIENTLLSPVVFDGTTNGLYDENSNPDIYAAATWITAVTYSEGNFSNVTTQPKYIIELGGPMGSATTDINVAGYGESAGSATLTTFRITARGTGGTDNAVILLQSNYARAF